MQPSPGMESTVRRAHELIAEAERLVAILVQRRNAAQPNRSIKQAVVPAPHRGRSRSPSPARAPRQRSRSPPSPSLEMDIVEPPAQPVRVVPQARASPPAAAPVRAAPAAPPRPVRPAPPARASPAKAAAPERVVIPQSVIKKLEGMKALSQAQAHFLSGLDQKSAAYWRNYVPHGAQDPDFIGWGNDEDLPLYDEYEKPRWIKEWMDRGLVDENGPVFLAVLAYLRLKRGSFRGVLNIESVKNEAVLRALQTYHRESL